MLVVLYFCYTSHVRYQNVRNFNPSVFLLVIFNDSYKCSPNSRPRSVNNVRMELFVAISQSYLRTTALIVGCACPSANLTISILPWKPYFRINGIGFLGCTITCTELHKPIRKIKFLQNFLCTLHCIIKVNLPSVRMRDCHQLNFIELMMP